MRRLAPAARRAGMAILLAGLVGTLPGPATAQDPGLQTTTARVLRLVDEGRNADAVDTMKAAFQAAPSALRQASFRFAARLCVALSDLDCAEHFASHDFVKDLQPPQAEPSTIGYRALLWSYIGVMSGGGFPGPHLFSRGFPAQRINPLIDPVLFAEFQLLAARQSRRAFDFEASRDHLDKALASTLSLQNERSDAPRLIMRIAGQLLDNYDTERALRLVASAEPILATVAPDSLLKFDLLRLRATLSGYLRDFAAASGDLRAALALLDRLQLAPGLATELRIATNTELLGLETVHGDRAAARQLLKSHPLATARPAILKRGHFASEGEFGFAVAEELVRLFLNEPGDTDWTELFEKPPQWTSDPEKIEEVQTFARAATVLRRAMTPGADARREIVAAARERVATLQRRYRQSVYASPLLYWTDRLLLELALVATLAEPAPDYDLVLAAHVVIARTLESRPDDALASQALQASDDGKRMVQALRAIDHQRGTWERTQLTALAARLLSPRIRAADKTIQERLDTVRTAADFAAQQARLRAALAPAGSDGLVTDLAGLRRLLAPDEALVFYVPLFDHIGKVCLRPQRAWSALHERRSADAADARLVAAALTADHPASVEADSRYPAAAAVRLAELLFGGLDDCLRAARRVYHTAAGGLLAQIPPAALLAAMPPRQGAGFDLRAARWLVRDHAFVRTTSIAAFVATRKLSTAKRATLDYLGVGDPVLSGRSAGELASLAELPEASEELLQVGRLFDRARVRILRREAAGEENFRLQPLSEFDVIHFATHGLIREDLPGLREPSLVLGPDPKGDAFNDGLLTASQIVALSLRTRLVVLSACNSARYDASILDDGIQGLSTAFAIAGVPTMIAALWPVESSLTRDLIVATFRAARGGAALPVADALADAVRRHLDGPSPRPLLHPRFWAPLVVVGDGALFLGSPGPRVRRELGAFADVDAARAEEIVSAAPLGGDVASAAVGPFDGKRSASLVRRQGPDGTIRWQITDPEIGAGPIAVAGQTIYVGGYVAASPQHPGIAAPVLRRVTPEGGVSWSRRLAGDAPGVVAALSVAPDRTAVALIGPTQGGRGGADFRIARFDDDGAEVAHISLTPAGDRVSALSGVLSAAGGGGLALVNRGPLPGDRPDGVDGYGMPRFCLQGDRAELVLFDLAAMRETARAVIERFHAAAGLAVDGGWIVVGGLRDGCGASGQAAAFSVAADGTVRELWRDGSPFDSEARAIRRVGAGFELVGRLRRWVAVREDRREPAMPDFSSLRLGDEGYLSDEVLSVRLSAQGKEEGRDFVAAGLPIIPMGMASAGDRHVIYGSVGSRPLWLSR